MSAQPAEFYAAPFSAAEPDKDSIGVQLSKFLEPFFRNPYEDVNLRFFAPKKAPDELPQFKTRKIPTSREALEVDEKLLAEISTLNLTRGAYFVVNAGGDKDADIERYNAFFCEFDDLPLDEQHALLDRCQLRPSIRVETKKSVHAYWLIKDDCSEAEWRDIQQRFIAAYRCDVRIKNPSRVMRVPFFSHITFNEENSNLSYKTVELVEFDAERRYTAAQMREFLPELPPEPDRPKYAPSDEKYLAWDELKRECGRRIIARGKKNGKGNYDAPCLAHGSTSQSSVFYNPSTNVVICNKEPACSLAALLIAEGLPAFPIDAGKQSSPRVHIVPNDGETSRDEGTGETSGAPEAFRPSDMGNGYRFARQHGDRARFCHPAGKWFVDDGKRWLEDASDEVMRLAKATAISINIEAAHTADDKLREALQKWARTSEAAAKLTAMLHMAQSELPVKLETFDRDIFLFNCENGTIDLRTGELLPHDRENYLTKLSPVAYDEHATAPKWGAFLGQIFEYDEKLIRFVQKAIGYSLTGSVEEQIFIICYGTGANGKSVFLKTIAALVAEYGQQVRTETLMTKKYSGVSNDIAALRGSRFLAAIETESDHNLAEATVKQLTGGDAVRARFLFHEEFEFTPQFKIWLAANHRPQIKGTDHAIWRRIKLVPFNRTIPKEQQNSKLDVELRDELPGILAWAVRGCLLWQAEGLGETEAITNATAAYRDEMDSLREFLADCCVIGDNYQSTVSEIYARYETWCESNGEQSQPARWLRIQLMDRGIKPDRDKNRRFWKGIGLVKDGEPEVTF
jgi:P4 family phage/plasmid primase-like protien